MVAFAADYEGYISTLHPRSRVKIHSYHISIAFAIFIIILGYISHQSKNHTITITLSLKIQRRVKKKC